MWQICKKSWHGSEQSIRQQRLWVTLPGHAEFRPAFLGTRRVPFLRTSDLEYLPAVAHQRLDVDQSIRRRNCPNT